MRAAPFYVSLALLTLLALAIRAPHLDESLWVDELHTAWTAADGAGEVAPRAMLGNQSPLYFYGVWLLTRAAGLSEFTLRIPSLLAGAALAPGAFLLVRRWTNSNSAALAAGLLAAINPDFLFYATEARAYALVQAAALVRLAVFLELLTSPRRSLRLAYVATAGVMFHLHYTTALLWMGEALIVTMLARRPSPCAYARRSFAFDSAWIALLALPAAPHVWQVFERRENWEAFVAQPTFNDVFSAPFIRRAAPIAAALLPPLGVLLLSAVMRSAEAEEGNERPGIRRVLLIVLVWIAAPVLIALAATATDAARLFLYRYLVASATAVPLMAGLLCGVCPTTRWRAGAALAAAAASLALLLPEYATQWQRDRQLIAGRQEDWRLAVAFINAHDDDALPVLVYSGLIESRAYAAAPSPRKLQYTVLPVAGLYRIEESRRLVPLASATPTAEAINALIENGGGWLMLRAPPRIADQALGAWRRRLDSRGAELRMDHRFFGFGNVAVARVSPIDPPPD